MIHARPAATRCSRTASIAGALVVASALLAGCATRPPLTRSQEEARTSCRKEVDRVYAAQNRDQLSRRSEIDTPFAAGYLSGITTRGLSSEYGRDTMQQDCLNAAAGPGQPTPAAAPGVGPAFTPAKP